MQVLLIEPYFGGSHRVWAESYRDFSRHAVEILHLPAQFWKWRMQGGAVTLARRFQQGQYQPNVILASDMVNLATLRALTRAQTAHLPIALYFHENQLSYPQNQRQGHGWRYGFVNYVSALAADALYFNSGYHRDDFFAMLPKMLKHFPDYNEVGSVDWLRQRAGVLPVGLDLSQYDALRPTASTPNEPPIVLWNHRWEADKNPAAFFDALYELQDEGVSFQVVLLGEHFVQPPPAFEEARERLGARVLHYGYAEDFAAYVRWLWRADFVVSTAHHDFFGLAVAEAIACGCVPILPRRLNYPALVPESLHGLCLYGRDRPQYLLKAHLTGQLPAPRDGLRQHIAGYDWRTVAARYDDALETLVESFRVPPALSWE